MTIKPYEKNAKKHSTDQVERIAASIKEFGFNQPIVVDKNGVIIVGHGRYYAAKKLGMEDDDIPKVVADLTEEQAKAYRIADNKLSESGWDLSLVYQELSELPQPLIELSGFAKELSLDIKDFVPTMNPESAPINITNKDVTNTARELSERFKKGTQNTEVMCPSCGHEFSFSGV